MKRIIYLSLLLILLFLSPSSYSQQGFLHADGINLVNGTGENVLLRGIGTGNWMLMEGYMMKTAGVAGTQHEIRAKLNEEIGIEKTNEFFETWLANHFTKTDVDSMNAWGFNSVRVAMHYKWFTLPIEEEPIAGNNTWINKGFEMMDDLLEWCADNQMYLILDLHGAPGGQGANADISDYDPSKPSLWESQQNKDKTIALWKKLAERYANETWIGGYDIINETNWTFPEGNNSQMRELFGNITDAIREVDQNHIIFIEGNSFANDHSGLTPPWDDNLVYSFHKYWSGTGKGDLDWILSLRDTHNVPLWLGESGENSNSWFTETIELSESHNIGWSWWPVKKEGINNVMQVKMPSSYETLVKIWKNETDVVFSEDEIFEAVMDWAENHKIENCEIKYDVIDAMFRQPHTNETKPFKHHTTEATIFASDYDYGKNNIAYFDEEVGFYGGDYVAWNAGWSYRNDGVDIEICSDAISNGYNVGWTAKGEWMTYTIDVEKEAAYTFELRYAAEPSTGQFHLELDNANIITNKYLPGTGGWNTWGTYTVDNVVLKKGSHQLKFVINNSGFNINYFAFNNPVSLTKVDPEIIHLKTDDTGRYIKIISNLGYENTSIPNSSDFTFEVNNNEVEITEIEIDPQNSNILLLESNIDLIKSDQLYLSYTASSMLTPFDDPYPTFSKVVVENLSPDFVILPAKIEAESYLANNGFELENCSDTGGGQNLAYANPGDYADYQVYLPEAGEYRFAYRVASNITGKFEMLVLQNEEETVLHDVTVNTGGWQNWKTQYYSAELPDGKFILRILVKSGEYNLNWFEVDTKTNKQLINDPTSYFALTQNKDELVLHNKQALTETCSFELFDLLGQKIISQTINLNGNPISILDISQINKGLYISRMNVNQQLFIQKIRIN